ncbi:MAG TPA: HAMP domain-containing sensor histidine kinase [Patescibacteria group bacterium]|nr:HAMP domain-containing sensor histidine kinase [Patescibacteria group bacterium]
MFQSARLKLTAWYLLIITLVSILFSIAIYNVATDQLHRVVRLQEMRQEYFDYFFPGLPPPQGVPTVQDIEDTEAQLVLTLVIINAIILLFAGAAAYFLAGRTLRPIKNMVDEQNRFVADASHELRTPLTSLRAEMEANLLEDRISEKDARQLIKSNLEDVIQLQSLSDSLLQLAQYKKTNNQPDFKDLSVKEIVQEAIKKVASSAKKRNINIDINSGKNIDKLKIKGEQQSLIQLLVNLLDNAIKYSSKNTKITIFIEKTDHSVRISISDQGIGIAAKDLPHIFDRFYRADKSRTKTITYGYGLGLSIAKMITDMHNGTISARSKMGEGTTFVVQLPLQ